MPGRRARDTAGARRGRYRRLAISRELARAMGGDLVVRSEEGKGSVIELMLGA
jgi:signal transduction histidine kinase